MFQLLVFDLDVVTAWVSTTAESELWMNNALASTEDVLDVFPGEAISANFPMRTRHYSTRNSGELIKSEFVVGHGFEVVVGVFPPDEHTISRINGLSYDHHQAVL